MKTSLFALGALLGLAGASSAGEPPAGPAAVIVDYRVTEQSAEAVERGVLAPLGRASETVGRVAAINGTATHGHAVVTVLFEGGANRTDLAAVTEKVDALRLAPAIEVLQRSITLGPPAPHQGSPASR